MSKYDKISTAALMSGQYDDALITRYDVSSNGNYLQFNDGIGRVGARVDATNPIIGTSVKSVHVRFRKYGTPTGPITVNIRRGTDDTIAQTIRTWPIESSYPPTAEQSVAFRMRHNTYNMVLNDVVSVEFPSNATNGFEIAVNTGQGNPSLWTGRQHNGTTWGNSVNPPAITIMA